MIKITIEGPQGSGKTTAAAAILAALDALNLDYTLTELQTSPANDVEEARRHHEEHGDMDGDTCMLSACALHYPDGVAANKREMRQT